MGEAAQARLRLRMLKNCFKPAQNRASPPDRAGTLEADGTEADAGGWRQEWWAKGGKVVAAKAWRRFCSRWRWGASWPFGGKVEGLSRPNRRMAGSLVVDVRSIEGVAGRFPLEWVAAHEVAARERLFPLMGYEAVSIGGALD